MKHLPPTHRLARRQRRPSQVLREYLGPLGLCAAVALGCLTLRGTAHAQQIMGWTFYDGGSFGKSGSATNGNVVDSSSEVGGDTTLGSISGNVSSSEIYIYHSGSMQTYGASTQFGGTLTLQVYNQPGETGAVSVAVLPYLAIADWYATPTDLNSFAQVDFSLTTRKNGTDCDRRQYSTMISGHTPGGGITVGVDNMDAYTASFIDGDAVQFAMSHVVSCANQWWLTEWARSAAWYSVVVSPNGYLSTGPRLPLNPPLPLTPLLQPCTTGLTVNGDHTQMTVSGTGGPTNAPLTFCVLSSPTLAVPLAHWTPCLTNPFAANGTFSFTIPLTAAEPQRFFKLRVNPH
jgi:hypothetical protein